MIFYLSFLLFILSSFGILGLLGWKFFHFQKEEKTKMKIALQNAQKLEFEEKIAETDEDEEEYKKRSEKRKEREEAEKKLEESLPDISSREISALVAKAEMLVSKKEYTEAEKILIQVLSFDEDHLPAIEKLARLYLELESFAKATVLFERVLEEKPHDAGVHTNYALSHFREKNLEKALEHYEKAVEFDIHNPSRYANLGQVLFAVKNTEAAIDVFHEAVKLDPRNIEYLYLLADAYRSHQRFGEAKKWYQRILDVSPYDADAQKEVERLEALGF